MRDSSWQRSSYCPEGNSCIHVSGDATRVRLTESGDPRGTILTTTPTAFAALLDSLKSGSPRATGIEVAHGDGDLVQVWEAGAPGAAITTTRTKWNAFVLGVRAGEFDHFAG
ncbi:DUF397 domain-containing protein [Streptomyces sp. NPDC049813]|uniref:DUF397 domain-containing protein n=1 Tax=Streptomyces sp. NPDC049813 TaxID=3365597 RepID=UPI0037B3BDEC